MYKDAFDKACRRGMVKIENAYAHVKNDWEVFKYLNFIVMYASQIIIACCVLHNFYRMNNEWLSSGKLLDAHPNFNDLRVPRRPTTTRTCRLSAIAIQHVI